MRVRIADLFRRWYKTQPALTDATGYVKSHARGEVIPPDNRVCKHVLGTREGFRRCNASVKNLVGALYGGRDGRVQKRVTLPCHLGLGMVAVRPLGQPDATFCCGLAIKPVDGARRAAIADRLRHLGIGPSLLPDLEELVVLDRKERVRVAELLEVLASELAADGTEATEGTGATGGTGGTEATDPQATSITETDESAARQAKAAAGDTAETGATLRERVRSFERDLIAKGLIRTHWNRLQLAKSLGISRTTLLAKMAEFGLHAPEEAQTAGRRPTKRGTPR